MTVIALNAPLSKKETARPPAEGSDVEAAWDTIYERGEDANEEPWSNIVSFINRFVLQGASGPLTFLELGCGSGSNLRFAARHGFRCSGIDISAAAVALCNERLQRDGLKADVRKYPFGELPFVDEHFDCVVDRASLMFADDAVLSKTVQEVHRVLKPGGLFFHNTVADVAEASLMAHRDARHEAASGDTTTYLKYPDFRLSSASDLRQRFGASWIIRELKRIDRTTFVPALDVASEWELVAQKA